MRKSFASNIISVLLVIFYLLLPFLHVFQDMDIKNSNKNLVQAGNFQMQTGGYQGNGNTLSIKGLGFAPDFVMLKPSTTAGIGAIFRTSAMVDIVNTVFVTTANTSGAITLDPDGFTVTGANANTVNVYHTWVAFGGSDCSATGNFCVGAYIGNNTSPRAISIGFQPDLVWVKPNGTNPTTWRTSSMNLNSAAFFAGTISDATAAYFTTLDATGFTVGASNNVTSTIYYYVAFKNTANAITVGSYIGNGGSQNINVGFEPDFVFTKNAASTSQALYNVTESLGLNSYYFTDTAILTTGITGLISTPVSGFSLGSSAVSNGNTNTHYYVAFAGASDTRTSSGTFKMAKGTYTGVGSTSNYIVIDNLPFEPDLVIIKGNTTQLGVFRTSLMPGDTTAYFGSALSNYTGGIVSINPNGFTIGTHATTNTSGVTYYWEAFGNAWDEYSNSGASDFMVGMYYGTGQDNKNITKIPFQPDLLVIKGNTTQLGVFRTSSHTGDISSYFSAAAEATNIIQSISATSFQLGTSSVVNAAATHYYYFAFKTGTNFAVGTYNGNGAARDITVGFQPDLIWVKDPTVSNAGVLRSSDQAGDGALPFSAFGNATGTVTAIIANGFSLGTSGYVNTNAVNGYKWVAWKNTDTPTTPSFQMQTGQYRGNGAEMKITGLGFDPDLVIINVSTTAGLGSYFKTSSMIHNVDVGFIASANGAGQITLIPDGFKLQGLNVNSINVTHTWIAFGGSDCTATGKFCVGTYLGNAGGTRSIPLVGFQPDSVWVKQSGSIATNWRSSSMAVNNGNYFSATIGDATGALFTTLDATGFTVGATNNAASSVNYFVAFKNVTNQITVGTYTGTGVAQNINVGFEPDFAFVKNSATIDAAISKTTEMFPNHSYYFSDNNISTGGIVSFITTPVLGFSVDTVARSNGNTNAMFYMAFAGASDTRTSSGTFTMAKGTYTGTGSTGAFIQIDDLDFKPDLVIVKGNTSQVAVFRTSLMRGDMSANMSTAALHYTGGIVSIESNGFTIGSEAIINTNGATYYWEAFGGAWNENQNTGSADFQVGTYYSSAMDSSDITRLPFQPDLITIKGNVVQTGAFKTSTQSGDLAGNFGAVAEAANIVQSISASGFQLGGSALVNSASTNYDYFTFKAGTNFAVGTYNGNGAARDITVGFRPDYIWIKNATATNAAVSRDSAQAGDGALPFTALANQTSTITAVISTGFSLGTSAYVNANAVNNYRWVAWRGATTPIISIVISDGSITFGSMNYNTSKDTITLSDTQQVTNNGNVGIDIAIKGFDAACPWTLASTVGSEQYKYKYEYSLNAGGVWTPLTTTYSSMTTNLTASSSQNFDLKLSTPTSTVCSTQQTIDLSLIATEH